MKNVLKLRCRALFGNATLPIPVGEKGFFEQHQQNAKHTKHEKWKNNKRKQHLNKIKNEAPPMISIGIPNTDNSRDVVVIYI